ncbi:MAG TPA: YXWGXW repeat-containing protein [Thermoanaerobaculia bacterium]|nr:YXWGXW repeat-containing protein [Thermoanaerobaculia bacterium]
MMRRLWNSILPLAVVAATALPARAQVPVPPLPHLEIHIAHSHPPRFRHEVRPERPGRDYVWIGGFWDWEGDQWIWVPGRWDRPAGHHVRWIRPRYVHEYGAYRYEPGHWSNQRIEEGDEYRRWRDEHHGHHRHGDDRDRDHDHDQR